MRRPTRNRRAKYQEKKKAFVQGASDNEVAQARASKEYKEEYDSAGDEMSKKPKDESRTLARSALEGEN